MKRTQTGTRPNAFQLDIAASIIELLQQRGVTSGELVSERDLASELGISRSPVRAALGVLVDRDVMTLEPGTGWRVARMPKQRAGRVIRESGDLGELELRIARDRFCGKTPNHFSEADFMKRYEITRGDLRKVLLKLSEHGMVVRSRGHGWHFRPMLDTVHAQRASYDLRLAIEPAALLSDTWTIDQARLARARQEHERALEGATKPVSSLGLFEMNARFHLMLAEFSRNEFFIQNIRHQNELRRVNDYFVAVTDERIALCREHLLIIEAIEKGDRLWAASLMERHLRSSRELLSEPAQPEDKEKAS